MSKIVKSIHTLKGYVSTIVGDDFSIFSTHVDAAESWVQKDILGKDLFDFVSSLPDLAENSHLDGQEALSTLVQKIISLNAYARAVPFLDLIQTDSGFAVPSSDNLAPASKERVGALIRASQTEVDDTVEALLLFLEDNTPFHDLWKSSATYSILTDTYLPTLKEFRLFACGPTASPKDRTEFRALHGRMRSIIAMEVEPVISSELSEQILEQRRDGELSSANKKILQFLQYFLAAKTLGNPDQGALRMAKNIIVKNLDLYPAYKNSETGISDAAALPYENKDTPFFICGA